MPDARCCTGRCHAPCASSRKLSYDGVVSGWIAVLASLFATCTHAASHRTVGLVAIDAPMGDIAAPEYVARFTADLHRAGTIVDCTSTRACRADVVITGTLVHSTEGGTTEIELESLVVATEERRTWRESPLDSDRFFADAAERAYAALVP
jgi:hypothetical protein